MTIQDFDRANEINGQLISLREFKANLEKSNAVCFFQSKDPYASITSFGISTDEFRFGVKINTCKEREDIEVETILTKDTLEIAKNVYLSEIEKKINALEIEFFKLGND